MASSVDRSDFPNVGQIVRNRARIARTQRENELQPSRLKSAEQANQLNAFNIRQAERGEATEKDTAAILERIRAGEPGAFKELAIQDPERLEQTVSALAKKRKLDTDEFKNGALAIMRMAVAGAQNPQDWQRMRTAVMRQHPGLTANDIPEKPSKEFIKSAIAFGSGVAALQKEAGFGQGNEFVTTGAPGVPGGRQVTRAPVAGAPGPVGAPLLPAPKAGKGGAGGADGKSGGRLPSGVSNTILRTVNQLFGDIFDLVNDRIQVLDPAKRREMIAVASRAEQLARSKDLDPIDAVAQAARELGIDIQDLGADSQASERQIARGARGPRQGADSPVRTEQLKGFADWVNKQP